MANTGRRYTQAQMLAILKEATDERVRVGDIIRRHGLATKTYYRWKAKLGNEVLSDASRLKYLEAENRRLKRILADQTLNIQVMKELLGKK